MNLYRGNLGLGYCWHLSLVYPPPKAAAKSLIVPVMEVMPQVLETAWYAATTVGKSAPAVQHTVVVVDLIWRHFAAVAFQEAESSSVGFPLIHPVWFGSSMEPLHTFCFSSFASPGGIGFYIVAGIHEAIASSLISRNVELGKS